MSKIQQHFEDILSSFYLNCIADCPGKQELYQKFKKLFTKNSKQSGLVPKLQNYREPSLKSLKRQSRNLASSQSGFRKSMSRDSSIESMSSQKEQRTDKHFKVHWLYQSGNFQKSLIYAYFFFAIMIQNREIFDYLLIQFKQHNLETQEFDQIEVKKIDFHMKQFSRLAENKQKLWDKTLLHEFQYLPFNFFPLIMKIIVPQKGASKFLHSSQNLEKKHKLPTKEELEQISTELGLGLNFFHVNRRYIVSELKIAPQKVYSLNIVYIQEIDRFMVSDRVLEQPDEDKMREKVKALIGHNVSRLLESHAQDDKKIENLISMEWQRA